MVNIGKPFDFKFYDQRKRYTYDIKKGYSKWVNNYDNLQGFIDLDLLNNINHLKEKIKNKKVLDLCCGTGRIGEWIIKNNPKELYGVDFNKEMLKKCKSKNVYNNLIYSDIFKLKNIDKVDIITCSLATCHIKNLDSFFKICLKLLNKKSWLIIIDFHPFFLLNGIPTTFYDVSKNEEYAIKNYIHSLSDYFNYGKENNFLLVDFKERFVNNNWLKKEPHLSKYKGMPFSFIMIFSSLNADYK